MSSPRGLASSPSTYSSRRNDEPGDQGRDPDQHCKGIVIEIAGLHLHHIACHIEQARRNSIRPESIDDSPIALFPEEPPDPKRRPNKDDFVKLIEVPLVQQELVQRFVLSGEFSRQFGLAD